MNARPLSGALLITLLIISEPALAATIVPPVVEGDMTWTVAESPYHFTGPTNFSAITPGATLTIEPGVSLEFAAGSSFTVFGDLIANGSIESPINVNGDGWQIVVFDSTDSSATHWNVSGAGNGLMVFNSSLTASNLMVSASSYGLMAFDSRVSLSDLDFTDAEILFDNVTGSLAGLDLSGGSLLAFNSTMSLSVLNIIDAPGFGFIGDNSDLNIDNLTVSASPNGINVSGGSQATLTNVNVFDTFGGSSLNLDASTVSISNASFVGGNTGVSIGNGAHVTMNTVEVGGYATPGIMISDSAVTGANLNIHDNLLGITNQNADTSLEGSLVKNNTIIGVTHSGEGTFKITRSGISGHSIAGAEGNGTNPLDARSNYWGHAGGPTLDPMNPDAIVKGDGVMGNVIYEPWLSEFCEADCHSNIMFLPGIMSSRLYKDGEQLWEPGTLTRDTEFLPLYLDENGDSIDPTIYTKDVLDNGYAYGQWVEDLSELEASGVINDYEAVPYDWRLSMEDVLGNGVKDPEGRITYDMATASPYIESSLRRLAANSKSGKVTIVAHSNGGLVTKALINKLDAEAASMIDKIIFVGVPQLGTPQAIGSLLHGYNAGLPEIYPFVLSPERARDLALNMPMIYQLMPFHDYHDGEGAMVSSPYVTFEDGAATDAFIDAYGYAVTSDELEDFLNGSEGRTEPVYDDLENAATANASMLAEAIAMQAEIDSTWEAPAGIEVHQIAGIGEDTLAGVTYKTIKKCVDRSITFRCTRFEDALSYTPNLVLDGDGTVVVPSALAMSDSKAKRWWVDLNDYNSLLELNRDRKHSDILEVDELRQFIFNNLLSYVDSEAPKYIHSTAPEIDGDKLMFTLHSPLSLSAVDEHGNVANANETTIPGANYQRFGEVQVITLPTGTNFTIILDGEEEGSFTLEMAELEDGEVVATSTLTGIPSSANTFATITFTGDSLEDSGALEVDYNGDGLTDLTYTPKIGKEIFTPDELVIESSNSYGRKSRPQGQVRGANSDTEMTLSQLQSLLSVLLVIKDKIPEEQYIEIESRVRELLNAVLINNFN